MKITKLYNIGCRVCWDCWTCGSSNVADIGQHGLTAQSYSRIPYEKVKDGKLFVIKCDRCGTARKTRFDFEQWVFSDAKKFKKLQRLAKKWDEKRRAERHAHYVKKLKQDFKHKKKKRRSK